MMRDRIVEFIYLKGYIDQLYGIEQAAQLNSYKPKLEQRHCLSASCRFLRKLLGLGNNSEIYKTSRALEAAGGIEGCGICVSYRIKVRGRGLEIGSPYAEEGSGASGTLVANKSKLPGQGEAGRSQPRKRLQSNPTRLLQSPSSRSR